MGQGSNAVDLLELFFCPSSLPSMKWRGVRGRQSWWPEGGTGLLLRLAVVSTPHDVCNYKLVHRGAPMGLLTRPQPRVTIRHLATLADVAFKSWEVNIK